MMQNCRNVQQRKKTKINEPLIPGRIFEIYQPSQCLLHALVVRLWYKLQEKNALQQDMKRFFKKIIDTKKTAFNVRFSYKNFETILS